MFGGVRALGGGPSRGEGRGRRGAGCEVFGGVRALGGGPSRGEGRGRRGAACEARAAGAVGQSGVGRVWGTGGAGQAGCATDRGEGRMRSVHGRCIWCRAHGVVPRYLVHGLQRCLVVVVELLAVVGRGRTAHAWCTTHA